MRRRLLLRALGTWLGAQCVPVLARAPVARIGYLHPSDAEDVAYRAFRRGLQDLGYTIGGDLVIEERFAGTRVERLPAMAAELVALQVDIIVAVSPTAIRAARAATSTIPIVMAFSGDDPVRSGFATTLARPGGNTTGLTTVALDVAPRWFELAHAIVPQLATLGVLRTPGRADHSAQIASLRSAAEARGCRLHVADVVRAEDFEPAFAAIRTDSPAIMVLSGPEFVFHRHRIVALAMEHRLASLYQFAEFVRIGGLLSYGPDIYDLSYRAAGYVDRILRGANPAEMPIEQPRKLALALNRRTAATLGLALPRTLVLQADEIV